ncbi:MAG TPA: SigE family RNA polymerase sigma factor [Marmoricola sp.]|nr:SigE family RNA polymerase sigma factor [Marmoricola sp.]
MDAADLEELYSGAYRRLVGQLYGVCGDLAEAEDVVQESFVRGLTHLRSLGAANDPEAWLRTVAVNLARTRWRRRAVGNRILRRGNNEAQRPPVHPPLSEDRLALVAAIQQLPGHQRDAVALHYLADLPVEEVAVTLGSPVGTVKSWLSRGRAALSKDTSLREAFALPASEAETSNPPCPTPGASHA